LLDKQALRRIQNYLAAFKFFALFAVGSGHVGGNVQRVRSKDNERRSFFKINASV
jgi:hypothetical protein